jgi:endonuclease/exonuclease/phosphatase family metal-dependent hydrolase
MNANPAASEMKFLQTAGLTSAQDITGNGSSFTFSSVNPRSRIDWIFGSPDLTFSDFVIPQSKASDHLPVVVTVHLSD